QDRVTGWTYNGLGQTVNLTAYNAGTTSQVTKYLYEDPHNASLVTNTIYPDSSDTTSSGSDQVKLSYHLDGSLDTRTDQRGVVMEYAYDEARRVTLEASTTIPASVYGGSSETDAVRSIGRTYDS